MSVTYKWNIPNIPLFDARAAKRVIDKESVRSLNIMTEVVRTNVVFSAPAGATGRLKQIGTSVRPRLGRVFPTVNYAPVIEKGRRAAPVAEAADPSLASWIRKSKKGRQYFAGLRARYPKITIRGAIFLLKRSMKRRPRKPNPFFSRGVKRSESRLFKEAAILNRRIAVGMMREGSV